MEHHQDYLKRQIEQAARVLRKILADLTGFKNQGNPGEGLEMTRTALKREFNIDIERLNEISNDTFMDTLHNTDTLYLANYEKLADVLYEYANGYAQGQEEYAKDVYKKILAIYDYLNESGGATFSFERHFKEQKIKNLLQN